MERLGCGMKSEMKTQRETCVCVCVWMERHAWVYVCVEKRMLYTEKKMGVSEWRER